MPLDSMLHATQLNMHTRPNGPACYCVTHARLSRWHARPWHAPATVIFLGQFCTHIIKWGPISADFCKIFSCRMLHRVTPKISASLLLTLIWLEMVGLIDE